MLYTERIDIEEILSEAKNCKILCLGDIMLDRYVYGNVNRISPEAPVAVLNLKNTREVLGGAGNTVANISALGPKVYYLGIVGKDTNGLKIANLLKKCSASYKLLKLKDYSSISKTRFIAGNNHILRLDEENKLPVIDDVLVRMERILNKVVKNCDIVILSDYNKGTFNHKSTQMIINLCKKYNKTVLVDPKGNDYKKYRNADYIKPNLKEFKEATGLEFSYSDKDFDEKIKIGAKKIFNDCKVNNLLITMSEFGILYISSNNPEKIIKLPTVAKEVFDVSGAGDTTISAFALGLVSNLKPVEAMYLANICAGIVVGKVGTACVYPDEIREVFKSEQRKNGYFECETDKKIFEFLEKLKKKKNALQLLDKYIKDMEL